MNETERLNALKDDYLEHYGVKGMKWGVLRSREELGYKSTPKKKRTTGFVQSLKKKRQAKLKAKAKEEAKKIAEAAKKAEEKAAKKAEEDTKTREKLLKASNKDLDFVYKNRHLLSNQELENTLRRINTEDALLKKINDRPSDFDKAMKTIKKISGTMDDIYSVWDSKSMKAIRKALGGEQESQKKDDTSKDKKTSLDSLMKKGLKNMSDDELSSAIKRLSNERTIEKLLKERSASSSTSSNASTAPSNAASSTSTSIKKPKTKPQLVTAPRHVQEGIKQDRISQGYASMGDLNSWGRSAQASQIMRNMDSYISIAETISKRVKS